MRGGFEYSTGCAVQGVQCPASISFTSTTPGSQQQGSLASSLSLSTIPACCALSRNVAHLPVFPTRSSSPPIVLTGLATLPVAIPHVPRSLDHVAHFAHFAHFPQSLGAWCLVPDLPRRFPWSHHVLPT